jgi:hypothetical protein
MNPHIDPENTILARLAANQVSYPGLQKLQTALPILDMLHDRESV